jgi:hypothetical protein
MYEYQDDTRDKNWLYRKQLTPLCETVEREAMTNQERIGGQTASGLSRLILYLLPAMILLFRYQWAGGWQLQLLRRVASTLHWLYIPCPNLERNLDYLPFLKVVSRGWFNSRVNQRSDSIRSFYIVTELIQMCHYYNKSPTLAGISSI